MTQANSSLKRHREGKKNYSEANAKGREYGDLNGTTSKFRIARRSRNKTASASRKLNIQRAK